MDWKKQAVEDLQSHELRQKGLQNIQRIVLANQAVRTQKRPEEASALPAWSDHQLNFACEEARLRKLKDAAAGLVEAVEHALDMLTPEEKRVLEVFYIHRVPGHVAALMEELGYEQRQIYKMKDKALYRFTLAMYGLTDF